MALMNRIGPPGLGRTDVIFNIINSAIVKLLNTSVATGNVFLQESYLPFLLDIFCFGGKDIMGGGW